MKASSTSASTGRATGCGDGTPLVFGITAFFLEHGRRHPLRARGNTGRSPRWRPPRTMARFTQARPPCTRTARMSTSLSSADSIACWCSTARQRRDLVAHFGRLLEFRACRNAPACASPTACSKVLGFAAQQGLGVAPHRRHRPRALMKPTQGAGAALDLVEQAGPGAVDKHRVFAGAQAKHFLQQLNAFPSPPRHWGKGQSSGAFCPLLPR